MPRLTAPTAAARQRRILDAATECFSRRGIHATTMQDICALAELSPGAVYCWFDSKEAIIAAVADDRHSREQRILQDVTADPDPRQALHRFLDTYFDWLAEPGEQRRRRLSIQVWAESLVNDRLRDSVEAGLHQRTVALDYVTAAQETGTLPPHISPDSLTRILLAIIQGFILQQAWEPEIDADSYRQTAAALLEVLMAVPEPDGQQSGTQGLA